MKILVTGGAGYIGSHTCVELLEAGHEVVVLDNLSNSNVEALRRVENITGESLSFVEGDILDESLVQRTLEEHRVDSVLHFAGLKAVGESVEKPLEYWRNNVEGTLHLLSAMRAAKCFSIVFSSSATVYGDPDTVPIREDAPLRTTNPYGRTKLVVEGMLDDLASSSSDWSVTLLRYFNPVGAHESGLIGEDPRGIPNNLAPFITQVAIGRRDYLSVFGNDYPTPDGTGVRDYIHVVDLAQGHLVALEKLSAVSGTHVFNLGTGAGASVLDLLSAFQKASGKVIPHKVVGRRPGDIATCYADPTKAYEKLGWKSVRGIDEMARDSWNWQLNNPEGFNSEGEGSDA